MGGSVRRHELERALLLRGWIVLRGSERVVLPVQAWRRRVHGLRGFRHIGGSVFGLVAAGFLLSGLGPVWGQAFQRALLLCGWVILRGAERVVLPVHTWREDAGTVATTEASEVLGPWVGPRGLIESERSCL